MTSGAIRRQKGDLPAGTQIGRYRIEDPVGRGGMGTVYRTYDETTNRNVALKLLAEGIPASLRSRFLAECEAEANIRHEHVMPVYDRGWYTEERPYFVMELLYEPITLTEVLDEINRGTIGQNHPRLRHWSDLRRLVEDVILPICEGVAVANGEYGVQHRDLKPDNVLLDIRTRRPYLIDFGICRDMDDGDDIGKIIGTPRFLSPEQAGGRVDPRTDVWGLGAILRYVVTGEPPLLGTSPFTRAEVDERIEALRKAEADALASGAEAKARGYRGRREQLEDPTLRVQEDLLRDATDGVYLPLPETLSAGLAAIIHKAMAHRSEDRYVDAFALVADLRNWLRGGGVQALTEKGARGAAVDWARRLLNQNVVRAVGVAVGLALGWVTGQGLFQQTPPRPDHRLEDLQTELARLNSAWQGLVPERAADALPPLGQASIEWCLREVSQMVFERADDFAGEPGAGPDLPQLAAGVKSRIRQARMALEGWHAKEYVLKDLSQLTASGSSMREASGTFVPGAYTVASKDANGFFLRFVVPTVPGNGFTRNRDGALERTVLLAKPGYEVPSDLTWVPAGPAAPGRDAIHKPLLAGRRPVTNEKYSEWLDDLPAGERAERVPPTGFRRSERDPSRWLVVHELATRAVVGVKPADAQAYALWRGTVEGLELRLPTASEWQRMAAIDRSIEPGADVIFPWLRAPWWRVLRRRGEPGPSLALGDVSPHGVRGLFAGPGEIVLTDDQHGFALKARGGIVPLPGALGRSEPIAADASGHSYGFRLVYVP